MARADEPQAASERPSLVQRMTFAVSPMHPWAESGRVDPDEMSRVQFIIYARATETHRLIEEHFDKLGVRTRPPLVLGDMEAIKGMSKIGLGVGIVAPWVAKREFEPLDDDEAAGRSKLAKHRFNLRAGELPLEPLDLIAMFTRVVAAVRDEQVQPKRTPRGTRERE